MVGFGPLNEILPGRQINISSRQPSEILNLLDSFDINQDTVILTNVDVWRYRDSLNDIFNHPTLIGKRIVLQTLGYTNTKFNSTQFEISYPRWYWTRLKLSNKFVPLVQNLTYGFSCLNNNNNIHRTLLGYYLYKNNLLPDIIFTQNIMNTNCLDRVSEDAGELKLDGYQNYLNLLPMRHCSELNVDNFANDHTVDHEAYWNAYCNIVTESECEEYPYYRNINLPVCTEKTYKPFLSRQIPLMLAARGHIKYLEDLGFEMMTDLLPSNFDNLPALQRIHEIVAIVKKGREFIKDFYFSHLREIHHNYELVNSDKVEKIILQQIKDTLNG